MKRIVIGLLAALCLFPLSACGTRNSDPATVTLPFSSASVSAEPIQVAEPTNEQRAEDLIASMTLEEKVGQLFFVRCPQSTAVTDISTYHLGGYLLFARDTKDKTADELIQTIHAYQEASKLPLLIGVDEEGGTVVRVSSNSHLRSSKYLSPQQLYADGGMEGLVRDTHEKDVLLSALGFNVNLAPVADVSTNPSDFIYDRSFGQNAKATAQYVSAIISQMGSDGMGSVLKHFPGYGNNVDTHTGIANDARSLESFQASDFLPFQSGIAAGLSEDDSSTTAVLVSHNIMTCVDDTIPASLSPAVHALLRDDLAFSGVVMTDDLAMEAVESYAEDGQIAVLALKAGNDLVLTSDYRTQIPQVLEAVKQGELEESLLDAACTRVLTWKMTLGLF